MSFEKAMEEVLKYSKYDYLTGRKIHLREKIMGLIYDFLEKILSKINIKFKPSNTFINFEFLSMVFFIILIIILVIVLFYFINRYINKKRFEKEDMEIFDEFHKTSLDYKGILNISKDYEIENDYRFAVRYQYLALIMLMSDKNIVHITDSMTGGQFLKEIKNNNIKYYEQVNKTINMFYYLWFGNKDIEPDLYMDYKTGYDHMIKEAENE